MKPLALVIRALCALTCVTPLVQAQDSTNWPAKPVTLVVGFPPGTATDSVARVLAERFSARMGQSFVIDNKPGQGGSVGAAAAAKAKPDGYTFVVSATAPMSINPYVYPRLGYDPIKDFSRWAFTPGSPMPSSSTPNRKSTPMPSCARPLWPIQVN